MLPDQVDMLNLKVRKARIVGQDVMELVLVNSSGADLPVWEPGAHIHVHLPSGVIRQYSLCGSPADRKTYRIAVLRQPDGRGGSVEVHTALTEGVIFRASYPQNHFPLAAAPAYLFIAGGIGITPILPMIVKADREGAAWKLLYGGRTLASMSYRDELADWPDAVSIRPEDEYGLLDLAGALAERPAGSLVYCCGPEPLIQAVQRQCEARSEPEVFHFERFGAGQPAAGAGDDNEAFEVELVRSGVTLHVPADRTLLEVVREVVPDMPSSCEAGYCGTCELRVVHGVPLHRDTIMTDEEKAAGQSMMICVGRSLTPRLGLDI